MNYLGFKYAIICILLIGVQTNGFSDEKNPQKKLTPAYKFNDGVFLSLEHVKENKPIAKAKILTTIAYDDRNFFEELVSDEFIYYYDNIGARGKVLVKNLWGYSKNGNLYINHNNSFNRITVIGAACHFVANYTTTTSVYDPYYYGTYGRFGYSPVNSYDNTEVKQYVLDFNAGKIYEYTIRNLEIILMADPELHDEYQNLSNRKKKKLKFLYLRKYNERNPVYMP